MIPAKLARQVSTWAKYHLNDSEVDGVISTPEYAKRMALVKEFDQWVSAYWGNQSGDAALPHPQAPQPDWEPVASNYEDEHIKITDDYEGACWISVYDDESDDFFSAPLPDNVRLCKRRPEVV